jgi:myo-inositol-1(or 4)-monophosphatase
MATSSDAAWETRKTGSAAIECALVGAGLLRVARFAAPNIWDIAGGVALVLAAGGIVRQYDGKHWVPLDRFEAPARDGGKPDLRTWRRPLIIGAPDAVELMCAERSAA